MAWSYKNAVVIDDAFGPPTLGSVPSEDKDAWVDFVLGDASAQELLMGAYEHLKPSTVRTLLQTLTSSPELIQDLWGRHERSSLHGVGLETLFATESLSRQATSEKAILVRDFLTKEIGKQNVQSFFDLPTAEQALAQTDVAFVDFFLRKNEQLDEALDRIRAHKDTLRKPRLLFFMSSRADINTQQRVREEIHMRSAFFEVMNKSDITEDFLRDKLTRKVADFEANQALEKIVVTLVESINDAAKDLVEATETLETHDLKLLNLARLEAEGESLPEYLTWLFSEFIAARARRNSRGKGLVALDPKQVGFTGQLRQSRAFFDLFSEVVFAPGRDRNDPLRFGEVLQSTKNTNEYLLLLTPACDFARCEDNLDVLCVRGNAGPFDGPKAHASQRLYGKAGSALCHLRVHPDTNTGELTSSLITWDTKSALTKPIAELKGDAYTRVQVMNELFAQEVKEEALRSFGRIGTQINPPPAAPLKATARWRVAKEVNPQEATTPEDSFLAALVMYSERPVPDKPTRVTGPLIVLSDAFRAWLKREIGASFGSAAIDDKLLKCLSDLEAEHFQAKASFQFKGNNFSIQVKPENEALDQALTVLLEVTLWTDPESEGKQG